MTKRKPHNNFSFDNALGVIDDVTDMMIGYRGFTKREDEEE